jgi:hypothetical protein
MAKMTQTILLLLFLSTFWSPGLSPAEELRWNFDKDEAGRPASGLVTSMGTWEIRRDSTAPSRHNVYAQTSTKNIEDYFPLAVIPTAVYKDFVATVKIKPISGQVDRSGGVVFRAKGADNYYVLRIEALRGSIAVYKTVRGTRSMIVWAKADIKTNEWQTLRMEVKGNRIDGSVNGQRLLTLYDNTFLDGGSIGIWTKSDAVTYFDDLTISKMD